MDKDVGTHMKRLSLPVTFKHAHANPKYSKIIKYDYSLWGIMA